MSTQLSNHNVRTSIGLEISRNFPSNFRISTGWIENNLCKKVVFGVNCWKYFLIALITFRSSSDKFVSGHFALYKLIAETLTFRASNLFLEIPFFMIVHELRPYLVCSPDWPNIACKMHDNDFQPVCQSGLWYDSLPMH